MAMHIGDHLVGSGPIHLDGDDSLLPFDSPPEPNPENQPHDLTEGPTNWLQRLPPLSPHLDAAPADLAWGEAQVHSPLLDLPAPNLTVTFAATAAQATAAVPVETAAAPFAGAERPVDASWLARREAALQALRADYTTERDQALMLERDIAQSPNRQGFNEAAFADKFLADAVAQGHSAWKTLSDLYGTDPAGLVISHRDLLALALTDHALNAGTPPIGRAMGSVDPLGITDLVLADPLMREIAQAFGGTPDAPRSALAQEQVRLYGANRYEQMTRLHIGMESVRDQYSAALDRASQSADGPGWVDVQVQREVTTQSVQGDNDLFEQHTITVTERRFDPDAYTRWYNAQDGLANRAFAQLYGNSHTEYQAPLRRHGEDVAPAGLPAVTRIRFDNAPWRMDGLGAPIRRDGLIGLDLNTAPRMNNDAAVGFDFEVGWATAPENIYDRPSAGRQVVQLAAVVAVGYFTWNPVNAWALTGTSAGGLGMGVTGAAVVAGGAAAAASSFASGVLNGNVELKDIVRSALTGALTTGLMQGLGATQVMRDAGHVGQTALRMTVQGGVQALMGGEFKDGAAMAFASGLAQAAAEHLNTAMARSLPADQVNAAQSVVRVVTSAIRALGNPDDPLSAFASSFLNDVLQDSGLAAGGGGTGLTNSVSGTPTTAAAATLQAQALAEELIDQGYAPDAAANEAMRRVAAMPGSSTGTASPVQSSGSAAAESGSVQTVVIQGPPLARDALGNRYQQGPDGQTTVYLAQGGMLLLASTQAVSITDGVAVPSWAVLRQLGDLAIRAPHLAAAAVLTGMPSNVGQGPQTWYLNTQERLQRAPGELWATKYALTPGGDWQPVLTQQTRPDGSQTLVHERYWVETHGAGYFGRSEEEIQRLQQPMTTPAQQPQGPTVNPLPAWSDRVEMIPGYQAQPATPSTTTTPGITPTWQDLLIEQSNSDNNRDLAQQRFRDNPSLQDPSGLAGRPVPGVGTWGYPGTPRGNSGAAYAEQLDGVPAGLELNVGGVPNAQGVITGGAWLDGVEMRNGQTTLIDRKDWAGYPPLDADFWHEKTVEEAIRQLNAAQPIGARVEWQFSTQAAADAVSALLLDRVELGRDARLTQINIRVVPKE